MRILKARMLPLLGTLALLAGESAYAQTGSIAGTILDSSAAGVSGATVKATNVATATVRTATTDSSGTYLIPNLAVGSYDVSVTKEGFAALTFRGIQLTVAQNLTLNGTLQLGPVSQAVEVAGAAVAPINLEDAQISNVVDSAHISDLPLITRDPYQLVLLSPGSQQVNSSLGGFSINGQRERNNNFLLDGTDNNDASVPGGPGGLITINPDSTQEFRVITNNFLPEFGRNTGAIVDIVTRSGTNQFHGDAYEFNRVNAMAARDWFNPSGTAQNPDPQNPFVRNQFGGSFGGPIVKNKTFFFVNSEWDRFQTTLTNESIVPTPAFKTGIFTYDGQQINLASPGSPNNALGLPLDPTMQKVFALYPNPNGPLVNSIEGVYFFPDKIPQDSNSTTFRVDQHFSEKYTLSLRYTYNGFTAGDTSLSEIFPGVGGVDSAQQAHTGSLNFIAALRPNLVNELRFGLNRADDVFNCTGVNTLNQNSTPDAFGFGTDYAFNLSTGVPTISNFGCGALGDSDGQARRAGTWSFADNLSWTKGNHNFKVGAEFRYVYDNGFDGFFSRPTVDFTAFGNFQIPVVNCAGACANDEVLQTLAAALLGVPGIQSQTQFYTAQGTRNAEDYRSFVQHEYGTFIQDAWKVRRNLTIQLGLRYEFDGVPFETDGNFSNLLNQQLSGTPPITFQTVGPGTGRQLYRDDYRDFEPRVGLAWDPFKDGKTSVRLGYGIFHDRVFGNLFQDLRGDPPFVASVQNLPNENFASGAGGLVTLSTLLPPVTQPAPSASVPDGSLLSGIDVIDPNLKTPYTQAWNIGIQRDLGHGMTLEVNYVGSGSHRLFQIVDGNPPIPALVAAAQANGSLPTDISGGALRYLPLLGLPQVTGNLAFDEPVLIESIGNATYNGLQSVFHKRLGYGLDFQAAYTYSHAIDDANDPIVEPGGNRGIARNSFNLKEDRGNSSYDLRHRLVTNFLYQLPVGPGHNHFNQGFAARALGGWELSGLSTFQSGHPMDLYSSEDSEYTGLTGRPDLVGNPAIPVGAPRNEVGPPITAFAVQPFGRPGNLGRNTFTGPTYYNTDVSLLKNTRIQERMNLQFRAEVYNIFNRIQFDQLGTASDTLAAPGTFGLALGTLPQPDGTTSARQIQLALKLLF